MNIAGNKIYVFCGAVLDRTPVVKQLVEHYRKAGIKVSVVEYKHGKRIRFFLKTAAKCLLSSRASYIFVGYQLYPALVILSRLKKHLIFWSLESYKGDEKEGLVFKLMRLERSIIWSKVDLIIPVEERRQFYNRNYRSVSILPNVPAGGMSFKERKLNQGQIKLIIYGSTDNRYIYLEEWIEMVNSRDNLHLTVTGSIRNDKYKNVVFRETIPHSQLLEDLDNYNFAVIGYRPVTFNHKYCAPNKLYEAFSLSLPVIVNLNNPTLTGIVRDGVEGLTADFSCIPPALFDIVDEGLYKRMNLNSYDRYNNELYFENYVKDMHRLKERVIEYESM